MADPLYELLVSYLDTAPSSRPIPSANDPVVTSYLNSLLTLPLSSLTSSEPQALAQSLHSTSRSLQALATRSNKSIIASADQLASLQESLPLLGKEAGKLADGIPTLDSEAVRFSSKYTRSAENEVLDRRKKALLMARNVDRLSDILDLPTLLSSAISSSATGGQGAGATVNYASALDLHTLIKRLHQMYPDSGLVDSILLQAEEAMQEMTVSLIASLRAQNIKLAAGMRTVGWLRRVAPELDSGTKSDSITAGHDEGTLGWLFLVCRLANLISTLEALDPLRDLAEQESQRRLQNRDPISNGNAWSGGQQTERYLKRYIEIFREQTFAIVSMYKSIFPSTASENVSGEELASKFKSFGLKALPPERSVRKDDPLGPVPSALATFPLHLVQLLTETLKRYMPNIRDKASRESLLTQVLYCAGSLGRLGGDFSMILAVLEDEGSEDGEDEVEKECEWVEVMKKHRILAGRLEMLASSVTSPGAKVPMERTLSPPVAKLPAVAR
ncbi:MAG: hypothetical protein FRX48_08125 [Lasallia pustulata]|uniref:Conserved oligomeric Golgi complex subunit 8 n=1 Tax=Lasallia pustulata TaxID=136370 RepID=A0A5M8PH61_9LECA|nr:MAG: hypothetical protein FRX48_08125 [Lasallia pustulata]